MDGKFVQVDEHYQTTINHVYAIGPCWGYQLAHSASAHGLHVVGNFGWIKTNASISKQYYTLYLYSS